MIFRDRTDAGQILARLLQKYAKRPDTLVLALPRGGVPVAYEIAKSLGAPMGSICLPARSGTFRPCSWMPEPAITT